MRTHYSATLSISDSLSLNDLSARGRPVPSAIRSIFEVQQEKRATTERATRHREQSVNKSECANFERSHSAEQRSQLRRQLSSPPRTSRSAYDQRKSANDDWRARTKAAASGWTVGTESREHYPGRFAPAPAGGGPLRGKRRPLPKIALAPARAAAAEVSLGSAGHFSAVAALAVSARARLAGYGLPPIMPFQITWLNLPGGTRSASEKSKPAVAFAQ